MSGEARKGKFTGVVCLRMRRFFESERRKKAGQKSSCSPEQNAEISCDVTRLFTTQNGGVFLLSK